MLKPCLVLLALTGLCGLGGCLVVKPVVGAGAAVGGAAVKTTAKVTTKAAGAAVDAVVPDEKAPEDPPKGK